MSERAVPADFVRSVAKGLAVIRLMNEREAPLTITEVADGTGLTRAGARRLLLTLEQLGYLRLKGRHYALTPRVMELSRAFQINDPLWGRAEPFLGDLVSATGETASAGALDDLEVVYVLRVRPPRSLHLALGPGTRLPAHVSSMGRVLLGMVHPRQLDSYFQRAHIERYTTRTITDPKLLRREIVAAGDRGYAIVNGEMDEGVIGVGAPVLAANGQAVAALNLSVSSARVPEQEVRERLLSLLLKSAAALSASLKTAARALAGPLPVTAKNDPSRPRP